MNPAVGGVIGVVVIILIMNFVALYLRMKKTKSLYGRRGKKAPREDMAAIIRDREVQRRIDLEQDRYAKHLDRRNKTWEMYEEVRKKHEGEDNGS